MSWSCKIHRSSPPLPDSFEHFLQRQKDLGYGRENCFALIRFVRKWQALAEGQNAVRARLRRQIEAATGVAERGWLMEKFENRAPLLLANRTK